MVRARVSLSVDRRTVRAGEYVTVSGRLVDTDTGRGIPNAPVEIYGDGMMVGVVKTDSRGNFSGRIRLVTAGTYTFRGEFRGGEY